LDRIYRGIADMVLAKDCDSCANVKTGNRVREPARP